MEISFPDDQIQRLFEGRTSLEAQFGCELATLICRRIAILQDAQRLSAVPTGRPPECRADKNGHWSVRLGEKHRLSFQPMPPSKRVNPASIKQIKIVGVSNS